MLSTVYCDFRPCNNPCSPSTGLQLAMFLLINLPIIFSINRYVDKMSEKSEKCPPQFLKVQECLVFVSPKPQRCSAEFDPI